MQQPRWVLTTPQGTVCPAVEHGGDSVDPNKKDYYLEVSRDLQIYATVLDVMGFCNFVGISPAEMEIIAQLLSKATGKEVTVADVEEIGKEYHKNRAGVQPPGRIHQGPRPFA
ncbi:MAG: aldehyde ferredoxin oxidoreductase C-terminal domain-containing protein [Syntrophomonadaceae bacterium]